MTDEQMNKINAIMYGLTLCYDKGLTGNKAETLAYLAGIQDIMSTLGYTWNGIRFVEVVVHYLHWQSSGKSKNKGAQNGHV